VRIHTLGRFSLIVKGRPLSPADGLLRLNPDRCWVDLCIPGDAVFLDLSAEVTVMGGILSMEAGASATARNGGLWTANPGPDQGVYLRCRFGQSASPVGEVDRALGSIAIGSLASGFRRPVPWRSPGSLVIAAGR
jgi:hypothetical protein